MAKQESKLQRYQQLQSLLRSAISIKNSESDVFDLDELTGDFFCLDNDGNLYIKYIPVEGDFVYVSDFEGKERKEVPLSFLSDEVTEHIMKCMTKAFLVNEIKVRL
jgi:hypothetical protein